MDGPLRNGDSLLVDTRSGWAYERVPKSEVEELVLEEVPDVAYTAIGGLAAQIESIQDAVELPFLHKELFAEHQLKPPKGVLLYGPPGCGKTLIAKAVANSLAKKVEEQSGKGDGRAFFLNIKGPELLNKYVGETERQIRLVFQRAREKASEGMPVIVFFDEMDSIFRTRGSGVSSDVENTIVPQLLAEIDGVELLENVVVIGASNREDMIDPAILRPGRLDVKIKVERPDAESARDIFSKYVIPSLPLHEDDLAEHAGNREATCAGMIQRVVERMYTETDENRFLEVTYANGDKEVLYFKDFNSGAMIENIVARGKKMAVKAFLETGQKGLRVVAPAGGLPGRVQGERGPAQHHQPGRLGPHQRQEGRADRLHPHPRHRWQGQPGRQVDRHDRQHRPVPVAPPLEAASHGCPWPVGVMVLTAYSVQSLATGGGVDDRTIPFPSAAQPHSAPAAEVRIGDAERQDAATQLQQHFAAGRLTWEELDERLARPGRARHRGRSGRAVRRPAELSRPSRRSPPAAVTAARRGLPVAGAFAADVRRARAWRSSRPAMPSAVLRGIFVLDRADLGLVVFGRRMAAHHHHGHRHGHHHGRGGS